MRQALLALALLLAALAGPAHAHLPIQLFQGVESYASGIIRSVPADLDLDAQPKMAGGLFQLPPTVSLEVELRSGSHRGQRVPVEIVLTGNPSLDVTPRVGERVLVSESRLADGRMLYQVVDYDRRPVLLWSTLIVALALPIFGRRAGLKALAFLAIAMTALYAGFLPLLLHGPPALPIGLAVALALGAIAIRLALPSPARLAASLGFGAGILVTILCLVAAFGAAHVSGLATADSLVLYSQIRDAQGLDYRTLWIVACLLAMFGGLALAAILTARALGDRPDEDAWTFGLKAGWGALPALATGTGLIFFGLSMPLLMIAHLEAVTPVRISMARLLNYDYLVSVVLAWESGILGMIAAFAATAAAARALRSRRPPVQDSSPVLPGKGEEGSPA